LILFLLSGYAAVAWRRCAERSAVAAAGEQRLSERAARTNKNEYAKQIGLGGTDVIKSLLKKALVTTALLTIATFSAQAKDTIVWWDFLGGGDGVRMKAMIEEFNKEHADTVEIQATTLDWGTPFYTKVQTSAAIGEGPDMMTYHLSRLPLGVASGALSEITPDELAAAGIKGSDYADTNWKAAQVGGKQYAVPLDIHSIILYYNKDLLKAAGLLGDDGKPKGLDGAANWDAALAKLTTNGVQGLSTATADGATLWRIFYTLLNQEDGQFMTADNKVLDGANLDKATKATAEMASWVKNGWLAPQTEYPASIALFTSGKAAFHINGVWEVPTMVDLAKNKKLGFEWGAVQIPTFYDHPATWADSHSFAIPNNKGKEVPAAKRKLVLDTIAWFDKHSLEWAGGGHLPAYSPVREGADFKALKPNSDYSSLAATAAFDPISVLAGVASPVYDAAGNFLIPAVSGDLTPKDAMEQMRDDLQGQVQ
jgi:multiple sugar transport system substrate-binding protein